MLKNDFTDYQVKEHILKNITILVDTRENANKHIIDYFVKNNINYEMRKLNYGDYGLKLNKNVEYGIANDMVLEYVVERKGSLEELSGNFTKDRSRIEYEMWRGNDKITFVIEDGSIDKIMASDYNTKYNHKSFIATLFTYMVRYGINYTFVKKSNAGAIIFALLYYKLREELK